LSATLCAFAGGRAIAHPLGNFTINHLAVVTAAPGSLRIHYVLDIAEIPSFQIMNTGAKWSADGRRAWIGEETARVARGLSIAANGNPLTLIPLDASATTRPGAGGLPTLYWTADFTATLPAKAHVTVTDRVYADRMLGWKDVTLPGHPDPTSALRSYPNTLIGSPRHNDAAQFDVAGDRIANVVVSGDGAPSYGVSLARSSALSDLFSRSDQTPLLVLLTILAAFGLGALHGLEPGHGKALLAFTLVGARATFKQAAILAAALTFAHTVAVLLLGLVLFFVAGFATESVFTWITLVSGIAVTYIGARSFAAAIRRGAGHANAHQHDHAHDHAHAHPHAHEHDHPHGHSHAIPGSAPLHFPSAVVAAMSGGIAPCPAAIVVLLTALHLHRIGYGLVLIVIFSLGLAAILTGLGFGVVRGAAWLRRQGAFTQFARFAPLLTASVISFIGATMLAQGLAGQGVRLPAAAVVAITLTAIAAFGFAPHLRSIQPQAARSLTLPAAENTAHP
jgi:nickel/cobalt transporter (NicO) family protein